MQRLVLKQNQSQKLSPQQIQFIKLLQLSNTNIESEIKKELEENPALEEKENNQEGKDDLELPNVENYNYSQKSNKRDSFNFSKELELIALSTCFSLTFIFKIFSNTSVVLISPFKRSI